MRKLAQIWVETVVYTIIGLALIGMVLTFALPKIQESKDRLVVEQTIYALSNLDSKLTETAEVPGNVRIAELRIQRGSLNLDGKNDSISFTIEDLRKPYSQNGSEISLGRISLLSLQGQKYSKVSVSINYRYNITVNDLDKVETLTPSPLPRRIAIEDKGVQSDGRIRINVKEVQGG